MTQNRTGPNRSNVKQKGRASIQNTNVLHKTRSLCYKALSHDKKKRYQHNIKQDCKDTKQERCDTSHEAYSTKLDHLSHKTGVPCHKTGAYNTKQERSDTNLELYDRNPNSVTQNRNAVTLNMTTVTQNRTTSYVQGGKQVTLLRFTDFGPEFFVFKRFFLSFWSLSQEM